MANVSRILTGTNRITYAIFYQKSLSREGMYDITLIKYNCVFQITINQFQEEKISLK